MATVYWLGTADAVAQVWTASIDSVDGTPADNTFTVTIGGVAISQVGVTSAAATAAALVALLNASTHPYFAAVTWTNPSAGNIVGTAETAGVPFVAALTETGAGTGAVTDFAVTTANAGPNDWSTAANWSGGAVPVNGDDVVVDTGAVSICWGLDQSAVNLDSLTVKRTYSGKIGLRRTAFATSSDGDTVNTGKAEYRDHYLHIGYDRADIGQHFGPGNPSGSQRIKIHNDEAGASTTVVYDTASAASETGQPAVRLLLDNSAAVLVVRGGQAGVGVAVDEPGETSALSIASISAGALYLGPGVSPTTLDQTGGTLSVQSAATITTATIDGGTMQTEGDYTITTLNVNGGTVRCNHTKTSGNAITTANVNGGTLNGAGSAEARTWATVNHEGGTIVADGGAVTITTYNEPSGSYTLSAT